MNPPQAKTLTYVRNLICRGSNARYEIELISQMIAKTPGNIPIGFYYKVGVKDKHDFSVVWAEGITISEGVKNALLTCGVTFR